jgi:hypothetical protein
MRLALTWLAVILLTIGAIFALLYYERAQQDIPPQSWQNPPIYPSAQNVLVQDTPDKGRYCFFGCTWTILSFQTSDTPEMVLEYYSNTLSRGGARKSDHPGEPGTMRYFWLRCSRVYSVRVQTRPGTARKTEVEVQFIHMVGDSSCWP